MRRSLLLTLLLLWMSLSSARPAHALVSSLFQQSGAVHVSGPPSAQEDTLAGTRSDRALGIYLGGVPGGEPDGLPRSNYLFGAYVRHLFPGDLFGEVRASIGVVNGRHRKVRLIPLEYRLNLRLLPVLSSGRDAGVTAGFSPYVYMGSGVLFHSTLEASAEPDPRTRRLNGRLPASSLFALDDGITPMFSLGVGMDIALNRDAKLQLNIGGTRMLNEIALYGRGYRNDFLDFSVGVNVRLPARRRQEPPPGRDPLPVAPPRQAEPEPDRAADSVAVGDSVVVAVTDTAAVETDTAVTVTPQEAMAVDTLTQAECHLAVQAGGYRSYENALEALELLGRLTTGHPEIYYDSGRSLYVVRSAPTPSLVQALSRLETVRQQQPFSGAVLYQRCGGEAPMPIHFQVQIAAFGDSGSARNHAESLGARYDREFLVEPSEEGDVYRVRTRAYPTLGLGREVLNELRAVGLGDTLFVARSRPSGSYAPEYGFILQLEHFGSLEEARERLRDLQPKLDLALELWYYRGDEESAVLGHPGDDWSRMQQQRARLEATRPGWETELYLIEREPAMQDR